MKFLLTWLREHVAEYRETYIAPLVAVLLILGGIFAVPLLTGRAVIDDPGAIVGFLYALLELVLIFALVGFVQGHFFGYRNRAGSGDIFDDLYDACVTFALLALSVWFLRQ